MHTSFLSYRRKPFVFSCLLKVPTDESLCALPAIIQWCLCSFAHASCATCEGVKMNTNQRIRSVRYNNLLYVVCTTCEREDLVLACFAELVVREPVGQAETH